MLHCSPKNRSKHGIAATHKLASTPTGWAPFTALRSAPLAPMRTSRSELHPHFPQPLLLERASAG
eukprot:4021281-Alexandrium_andersonii.AAC.1